jgi:hypothetical protein
MKYVHSHISTDNKMGCFYMKHFVTETRTKRLDWLNSAIRITKLYNCIELLHA